MWIKKKNLLYLLFLIFILITGCSEEVENKTEEKQRQVKDILPSTQPEYGDSIIYHIESFPLSSNPFEMNENTLNEIGSLMYEFLFKFKDNYSLDPILVESYKVSEDKLTWFVTLKKGILFHDNNELTARDVVFSFENAIRSRPGWCNPSLWTNLDNVSAPENSLVIFRFSSFNSHASLILTQVPIVSRKLWVNEKEGFRDNFPAGTGPFYVKNTDWKRNIELSAFKKNKNNSPYLNSVIFKVIEDRDVVFEYLREQKIDFLRLTSHEYSRISIHDDISSFYKKWEYHSRNFIVLAFNLNNKNSILNNPNIRKAIETGINKHEIIAEVYAGNAVNLTGPFPPSSFAYNNEYKSVEYDSGKAMELFLKEGYEDSDGDGFFDSLNSEGVEIEPLTLELLINQESGDKKIMSELLQGFFEDMGILLKVRKVGWEEYLKNSISRGNYEMALIGFKFEKYPDPRVFFDSSSIENGLNVFWYKNPRVDDLLMQVKNQREFNEIKEIYHEIHTIIAEDRPCLFLCLPLELICTHRRFSNFYISEKYDRLMPQLGKVYVSPKSIQKY